MPGEVGQSLVCGPFVHMAAEHKHILVFLKYGLNLIALIAHGVGARIGIFAVDALQGLMADDEYRLAGLRVLRELAVEEGELLIRDICGVLGGISLVAQDDEVVAVDLGAVIDLVYIAAREFIEGAYEALTRLLMRKALFVGVADVVIAGGKDPACFIDGAEELDVVHKGRHRVGVAVIGQVACHDQRVDGAGRALHVVEPSGEVDLPDRQSVVQMRIRYKSRLKQDVVRQGREFLRHYSGKTEVGEEEQCERYEDRIKFCEERSHYFSFRNAFGIRV